jgi:hypothetical protein
MIKLETIKGQKSWILENGNIKLCLTEKGGHMAPVVFFRDTEKPVKPFYINPWAEEGLDIEGDMAALDPLRGDFFCLPFGEDNSWNGEFHPLHGETSGSIWNISPNQKDDTIELQMNTTSRKGKIVKRIKLAEGENNLYISHVIEGFSGPAPLGHHVIFPGGVKKYISTSPVKFGYTAKNKKSYYEAGVYHSLASFIKFTSLEKVPTIWKDNKYADCSVFPIRRGFEDVIQLYNAPIQDFAWAAVTVPEENYLWFSLKDPQILPSTVIWMENYGEHQHPWNGRNCCLGIEDVCSYFADGLGASVDNNFLNEEGIKTCHHLQADIPLTVNYIQGIVMIPEGFDRVKTIEGKDDGVMITSFTGKTVFTKVDSEFLF